MIKTKFKHIALVLLVVVLSLTIALVAVACKDKSTDNSSTTPTDDESPATTETLLITNGDFAKYTAGTAPYTPSSWDGASYDSVEQVSGVIPLDESLYNNARSAWDSLAYPGNPDEDDKFALLIYNKQAGGYAYRNTGFKTTIGAFYKIDVTFRVLAGEKTIAANSGAFVRFYNLFEQKFGPFGVTDGWQTVTLYLQASQVAEQNLYIELSMGTKGLPTEGYAFFHDVTATKISASDYVNANIDDSSKAAKVSALLADPEFDAYTGTSSINSTFRWNVTEGEGNGAAPSTSNLSSGVLSLEESAYDTWATSYGDDTKANPGKATEASSLNVLALSNEKAIGANGVNNYEDAFTARGYTAASGVNVEPGTYYLLSVWVYTDLNDPAAILEQFKTAGKDGVDSTIDHSKYGANIRLSGNEDVLFENINTNKTWKQYTFVLIGHEYRPKQLSLSLWLGYGGAEDGTRASGTVFFDTVTLENKGLFEDRAELIAYYNDPANVNLEYTKVVDVSSLNGGNMKENIVQNSNFDDATDPLKGWQLSPLNDVRGTDEDVKVELIDVDANADKDEAWWKENYAIDANPQAPYGLSPVLMINNVNPSAYRFKADQTWEIGQNLIYRLGVWLKTANIKDGSGLSVYLKNADDDSTVSSFTKVNTASYENELTNDYVELVFYLLAGQMNVGDNGIKVYLDIEFGSGNNYSTSGFLSGQVFIANVNMEQVTYSEYNAASSGTYTAKKAIASNSSTVSNGNFNEYQYDGDKIDAETGVQKELLKPSSSYTTEDVADLKSGILNVNSTALINSLLGDNFVIYNAWDSAVDTEKPLDFGAPNLFVAVTDAYGTADAKSVKAIKVLTSGSMSLSNNSYYIFKGYIRSVGTKAQLQLSTTSNNSAPLIFTTNGNGDWEEVIFVIETGNFATASMKFTLYFGEYYAKDGDAWIHDADATDEYQGAVLLDSLTYLTITKSEYDSNKVAAAAFDSYLTDTFDTSATDTDSLSKPNLWTSPSASSNVKSGIYSKRYSQVEIVIKEKQTVTDADGNETTNTVTVPEKTLTTTQIFDETGLDGSLGDGLLIINNQQAYHTQYSLSSSVTLSATSYYHFSVDARTYFVEQGKNAIVKLSNGKDDFTFSIAFNSDYRSRVDGKQLVYDTLTNEWQSFHFYVATSSASVSSVKLYLILGEEDNEVQGDALFDNVKLEKIDEEAFLAQYSQRYKLDSNGKLVLDDNGNRIDAEGSQAYLLNNRVVRLSDNEEQSSEEEKKDDEQQESETKESTPNNLLWLYITSIVIAAVLLVVIVVLVARHFARKRKKSPVKAAKPEKKQTKVQSKDDKFKD